MSAAIRRGIKFFLTDRFIRMEVHRRDRTLVPRQLPNEGVMVSHQSEITARDAPCTRSWNFLRPIS